MDADLFLQKFGHLAQGEGGIKKLRDVILQLAVQGKLVAQNPADENASIILKKIKTEQKSKKNQDSSTPNDSELYPLPAKWVWTRLGHIAAYGVPQKVNGNDEITPDTWVLDLEDIEKDTSRLLQRVNSEERSFQSAKTVFQKGDVLFGKLRPYLNKVLVSDDAGVCTTEIVPIRAKAEVNPNYIRLVLQSPMTMRAIERLMYGMKMPRLGTSDANNLSFPLPPLAEQKRIVAKVDELMALCDKLEAEQKAQRTLKTQAMQSTLHHLTSAESSASFGTSLNILARTFGNWFDDLATVKHLRATILQLAVQGKLVPQNPTDEPASELLKRIEAEKKQLVKEGRIKTPKPLPPIKDAEIPFLLPDGWQWVRLETLATLITKGSSPKWQGVEYLEKGLLFITSENVGAYDLLLHKRKYVDPKFNEIEPRSILQKNDILMNIVGASIGRTAIYNIDEVANINQAVCLIRIVQNVIDNQFFLHFCNSEHCLEQMFDKQVDNARANLSMGNIAKFAVPLPPLAEQKRIVTKVDELMTLCDQLEAHITHTQTLNTHLMDSLIHRMTEAA